MAAVATIAPYGSWRSPITTDLVASEARRRLRLPRRQRPRGLLDRDEAAEEQVATRSCSSRTAASRSTSSRPDSTSARACTSTAAAPGSGTAHVVFCSSFDDSRLYRIDAPGARAATDHARAAEPHALRYADGRVFADGRLIVCVRESHGDGEPVNELVVASDGRLGRAACRRRPAATSTRRRGRAPTASASPGSPGITRTCRSRARSCASADLAPGRHRSTDERRVAGVETGVHLPAGVEPGRRPPLRLRPDRLVEPLRRARRRGARADARARRSSATRSGSSTSRATRSSPTGGSRASSPRDAIDSLDLLDPRQRPARARRPAVHAASTRRRLRSDGRRSSRSRPPRRPSRQRSSSSTSTSRHADGAPPLDELELDERVHLGRGADRVPGRRRPARRTASTTRRRIPTSTGPAGRAAAARRLRPRRADRARLDGARPRDPVLHEPRDRRRRPQLRRQHRLRPRVPGSAARALGRGRRRGQRRRRAVPRASGATSIGERVEITGGSAGGYTTLLALALRDEFAAGASYFGVADLVSLPRRDAQVRIPLRRVPRRPLAGGEGALSRALAGHSRRLDLARRCCCCRGSTTRSSRRLRPR